VDILHRNLGDFEKFRTSIISYLKKMESHIRRSIADN